MGNPYLQSELRTASPEAIVGRLLDRAGVLVRSGIAGIESAPVESSRSIAKAVDIVSELRGALDMEAGGEISTNLDALYAFVAERLVLGGTSGEPRSLEEALRVLETLAETWQELLAQQTGRVA